MTRIDELADLVRTVERRRRRRRRVDRPPRPGTGFVVAPGKVLTNAHNLRDETTEVGFADGRAVQGAVAGSDVDGDLVVLDVDTGDVAPLEWSTEAVAPGDVVVTVTAGRHRRRAAWGQVTSTEAAFRGPRGRPIQRRRRAHRAVRCRVVGRAGARPRRAGSSASTRTASSTASTSPAPTTRRCATAIAAMAEGRRFERVRLGVALAPPRSRPGCAGRSGSTSAPGCSCAVSSTDSPAAAAGHPRGRPAASGRRTATCATPDDLFAVLADVEAGGQLAIALVRGAEELTVTVTF